MNISDYIKGDYAEWVKNNSSKWATPLKDDNLAHTSPGEAHKQMLASLSENSVSWLEGLLKFRISFGQYLTERYYSDIWMNMDIEKFESEQLGGEHITPEFIAMVIFAYGGFGMTYRYSCD